MAKALRQDQDCPLPKGSCPWVGHTAHFPRTSTFLRLCKYNTGSAAANRKLKQPCLRGVSEHLRSATQNWEQGTPCYAQAWYSHSWLQAHSLAHRNALRRKQPPRRAQFSIDDDVTNRHVQELAWGRRTIHPAGCLKDTALSYSSCPSLRVLKMKVLS